MGAKKSDTKRKNKVYKAEFEAEPINKNYENLSLSKLKPIMIRTGYLESISIEEENEIELSNSWTELCLLLLWCLNKKEPLRLLRVLLNNDVISQNFNVTSKPSINIENKNTKVYKIADSELYLETNMHPKDVLRAITGMVKAIGYNINDIKLNISPLKEKEIALKIINGDIAYVVNTYKIKDAISKINNNEKIQAISIMNEKEYVSNAIEAAAKTLEFIVSIHGESCLKQLEKRNIGDTIGITKGNKDSTYSINIGDTGYKVYGLGYIKETALYIGVICREIGLSSDLIEIDVEQLEINEQGE